MNHIMPISMLLVVAFATMRMAGNAGLIHVESAHGVAATAGRLERILAEKGIRGLCPGCRNARVILTGSLVMDATRLG